MKQKIKLSPFALTAFSGFMAIIFLCSIFAYAADRQVRLSGITDRYDPVIGWGWTINTNATEQRTEFVQVPATADTADVFINSATLNTGTITNTSFTILAKPLISGATVGTVTAITGYGRHRVEVPAGGQVGILATSTDSVTREINIHFNMKGMP